MYRVSTPVILFAHRTFPWESEARGKAHVHVVIIGFSLANGNNKRIFDYENGKSEPAVRRASNINAYLVDGPNLLVESRTNPISDVPPIVFGSMPNDGGHLLLDPQERRELLAECPEAKRLIRRFVGAEEFINGIDRWCLWLVDASPDELRRMEAVMRRIAGVRSHRQTSRRATTRQLAATPALFGEIRQPTTRYLLIPSVSSVHRKYIPIGFNPPSVIASNLTLVVPMARLFHFGVLSSAMHMAWVRQVSSHQSALTSQQPPTTSYASRIRDFHGLHLQNVVAGRASPITPLRRWPATEIIPTWTPSSTTLGTVLPIIRGLNLPWPKRRPGNLFRRRTAASRACWWKKRKPFRPATR
jgi:hypothetical protein